MKYYPTYRWHDFWSRDQETNFKRHRAIVTKSAIIKRSYNTYQNETLPFQYVT